MQRMKIDGLKKISISKKITIIYSIFFLLLLVVSSAFILINAWLYYGKVSRDELEETADKIVSYIEENGEISEEKIQELNPNKYIVVAVNERGKIPPSVNNMNGFPPPEFDLKPHDEEGNMHFRRGEFNNMQYMYTMRRVDYGDKIFSVQVFRQQSAEVGIMRMLIIIFLIINAFAVLLSVGIGRFISNKMLQPIREMTKTVDNITAEDLSRRIDVPVADDEFRSLAITFNNMFERLENSFEKQKQFVSDASHELRTPISVIQGYANLVDRWGKSDGAVLDEAISSIKSETEHMNILINQLLFLAREDKGTSVINKEKISIYDIANEVLGECEMTSPEGEVVTTLEGDKDIFVFADSHLIKQAFRIITENAVKYTKEKPCKIDVTIKSDRGKVLLTIKDNGVGIPKEDISHIFDRFYRGDKSRNKQIPGNGLGLSIALSIVKSHNGRIWVESEAGKGTAFYIELDRAK